MNLQKMPEHQRLELRQKCLRSLYCFCIGVMGYEDITDELHGAYCRFLENPSKRKQVTMPRSFVKTWIGSIAYPIWVTLPRTGVEELPPGNDWNDKFWRLGPDMRILVSSYVISNAEKMIGLIRKTYESNPAMQMLFPEVIPVNFNKTRWSNESACINRETNFTESTFEAAGIGGASTSRHYDLLIEDDLVYAKKDDLGGKELQPGTEDIDKAIGWHKMSTSLLVPGDHTRIYNIGTRWSKHDLVDFIWVNEPSYDRFIRGAVSLEELESGREWKDCTPEWEECYGQTQLQRIYEAQGPYMFATQYLLKPMAPEDMLFHGEHLQFYISPSEIPTTIRKFTTVDLAGWGTSHRSKGSRAVVLTCGWCHRNHLWLLHYDVGRFDPSEIIKVIAKHYKLFSPEIIGVETVYYQKALVHFARKEMESGRVPWMPIRQMMPEGNESKEIRIRALEPIASNLAIHCKREHKEFINEFSEYVPNNDSCTKDILDAMAYQVQIARAGAPLQDVNLRKRNEISIPVGNMDEFLESIWKERDGKDIFGNPMTPTNPFNAEEGLGDPGFNFNF